MPSQPRRLNSDAGGAVPAKEREKGQSIRLKIYTHVQGETSSVLVDTKRAWSAKMRIADAYGCQMARQKLMVGRVGTGFVKLRVLPVRQLVETVVQALRFVEFWR